MRSRRIRLVTRSASCSARGFDLILLDMVLLGIGNPVLRDRGSTCSKRVRELRVQTPVVMISGDCGSRKEADALTEGEFGYVHKPFDVREMDRVVAKAIVTPA